MRAAVCRPSGRRGGASIDETGPKSKTYWEIDMDESNVGRAPLDDLERDAERDRARLAGTVEALRERLGGGAGGMSGMLTGGARHYASRGIRQRLEDHPLQSVALAAGIAYPLVRIVTKIPAPILLLGAGVAMAGRGGASGSEDEIEIVARPAGGTAATDDAGSARSEFREPRIARTSEPDEVMPPAGTATVGGAAGDASDPGPDRLAAASDAAVRVGRRAAEAGRAGGETLLRSIRRNPAAAGGASLLIGAALAAMLPRTRIEGRAVGETAESVRERARALAAEGIESAQRVVGVAAGEARSQNLTGSGVREAIREGADRLSGTVRDAADDAQAVIDGSAEDAAEGKSG